MTIPWSPQTLVNDTTTGTQTNPNTTTLSNGNFVVVWEDTTADTIHYKIYDPTGVAITDEMTVSNSIAEPDGYHPSVAAVGDNFVIAHESVNPVTSIYTTVYTIYNSAGVEISEHFITSGATQENTKPDVFEISSTSFGITTLDENADEVNVYVYDAAGAVLGSDVVVGISTSATHPVGVYLTNGDIAIAWENSSTTGVAIYDVGTHTFTFDGTFEGDSWGVPKIIAGPLSGTFVVAFNDYGGAFPGNVDDPKSFLFDASGTVLAGPTFLSDVTLGDQGGVEIVALSDGTGYLALWFDEGTSGSGATDLYMARTFDWYGNPTSNAVPFASDYNGSLGNGSILEQISATVLEDGRIAVSYDTGGIEEDTFGVALTILDPRDGAINGTSGIDVLHGGANSDIIFSQTGDDTVYGGGGNDFIYDALEDASSDDDLFGGTGDDLIMAGAGFDLLDGNRGNDSLFGGSGEDEIYGGNDDDYINGGDGDDEFLRGNNGADTIDGGAGRDFLGGGPAADEFQFSNYEDSVTTGLRDRILDFQQGSDKINVSLIDANTNTDTDDAFTFVGTDAFSNTAGEMRYLTTASKTIVQMDIDGDGAADSSFELTGVFTLLESDFML